MPEHPLDASPPNSSTSRPGIGSPSPCGVPQLHGRKHILPVFGHMAVDAIAVEHPKD